MSFEITKASRTAVKPLICFYSESGCGKTYSALLFARGFVGPTGSMVMVDTESGRGSLYADVIPGGYSTLAISAPFAPSRAIEAMKAVEKNGAGIGILDSGSHFWEGIGGVLDMAGEAEAKSGKPGLHNWRAPKMEHAKFVLALLQSPIPWIICLRAKFKTKQTKNPQGRTEIVKDDFTTPLQADDFIFESTCHGEIMQDHTFRLTKCSHPALRQVMPNNELTTIRHGEMLAAWCASPGGPVAQTSVGASPAPTAKELRAQLWKLLKPVRGIETNWTVAQAWLVANGLLHNENMAEMIADDLFNLILSVEEKLKSPTR